MLVYCTRIVKRRVRERERRRRRIRRRIFFDVAQELLPAAPPRCVLAFDFFFSSYICVYQHTAYQIQALGAQTQQRSVYNFVFARYACIFRRINDLRYSTLEKKIQCGTRVNTMYLLRCVFKCTSCRGLGSLAALFCILSFVVRFNEM